MIGMSPIVCRATTTEPRDARPTADPFAAARSEMVTRIRGQLMSRGLRDDRRLRDILRVIGVLRREAFVPDDQRSAAYSMDPLPIGYDQTISDAFIQAYMTRMLNLRPNYRVLEIGTGSGYQAAVLGSLVAHVYTIELVPELAQRAAAVLSEQGFRNVEVRQGDGYLGWPDHAPFDAIIITAGAAQIPPALLAQLRPGGRMILPLGPNWAEQQMTLVRKRRDGTAAVSSCGSVFFVPFVGVAQTRAAGAPAVWGRRLRPECFAPLGLRFRVAPAGTSHIAQQPHR